ncbi:MAG: TVP38/TMEM64 family protein [Eggerthellaceae bacterium]|jgi:uncharacterized membrane protein YdjX (TVP38/TMEM64 family)
MTKKNENLRSKEPESESQEKEGANTSAGPSRRFSKSDIFRFSGLIVFLGLMGLVVWAIWPLLQELFQPGGIDRVITDVQNAGPLGVFILLGLQLLQIVVAFIPGEVVQLAAGMMYGPWLGALIILIGCICSSALIFALVRTLGAPFVHDLVPTKHLEKFKHFEESGRLSVIVFILFLIPGMPKDVFTYLVPLTDMPIKNFLIITNTARIPGILMSTFGASSLIEGNIGFAIAIFGVAAVIGIIAILKQESIMQFFEKRSQSR